MGASLLYNFAINVTYLTSYILTRFLSVQHAPYDKNVTLRVHFYLEKSIMLLKKKVNISLIVAVENNTATELYPD
jgi:hypothetical protein